MSVPHGTRQPAPPDKRGPAREMGKPEVGFYMMRMTKGAPEVPARIWWCDHEPEVPENKLDRPAYLAAEIAGKWADPEQVWTTRSRRISAAEYAYQISDLDHAQKYRPGDPKATPDKPIDLLKAPLPF